MFLKKILKYLVFLISLPILYLIASVILTSITVNKPNITSLENHIIYLSTNGVHLDIVIPKSQISSELISDLKINSEDTFIAFAGG